MKEFIKIEKEELERLQEMLEQDEFISDFGKDDTIETFSVSFGNGLEADIKVCNGDGPYVDAILFDNGREVCVLDPSWELVGEYIFEYNDVEYVVIVTEE